MTFAKTLIIALGINFAFSSILCASLQEEQKERTRKVSKSSEEQRKKASALIKKYQNPPQAPAENCRTHFSTITYITPQGQVVHTE